MSTDANGVRERPRARATTTTFGRRIVTACACGLAALLAAPAGAWPAAPVPVDLSAPGQSAIGEHVAVDPQGNAVATWQRSNGANIVVQAAVRPAGGAWQAPVDLSAAGQNGGGAQVAMDAQGNAVAVWSRSDGAHGIVQSATRPAGGSWQPPVDLSAAGQDASSARVAVDPRGDAVAVWLHSNGVNDIAQGAVRPAGGSWQAPTDLSTPGQDAVGPRVAIDASGGAVAAWTRSDPGYAVVQTSARPTGGAWQAPVDLSPADERAIQTRVAVSPRGDAVVVWSSGGEHAVVHAATRPAGGSWEASVDLSAAGDFAQSPDVAVDAHGNAIAVWEDSAPGTSARIEGAVRPAGGPWQAGEEISTAIREGLSPIVAVDPRGNAVVTWTQVIGTSVVVQAAARPVGGLWQAPDDLSAADGVAFGAPVAVDAQGRAVVVFQQRAGAPNAFTVRGVGYLAARPLPLARVTRLSVSPRTFRAARAGSAIAAPDARTGSLVSYVVNVAGTVRFKVERVSRGRVSGGRCVTQTVRNRGRAGCERIARVAGGFARSGPAGAGSLRFTGRVAGRTLKPGAYRLSATANGRTAQPARFPFRVARPRR